MGVLVTAGHFPSWPCPWPQTHTHALEISTALLPRPHGPMTSLPTSPFQGVGGGDCHGPVSWAGSLGNGRGGGEYANPADTFRDGCLSPVACRPDLCPAVTNQALCLETKNSVSPPHLGPRPVSPAPARASDDATSLGGETGPWQGQVCHWVWRRRRTGQD